MDQNVVQPVMQKVKVVLSADWAFLTLHILVCTGWIYTKFSPVINLNGISRCANFWLRDDITTVSISIWI